MEIDGRGPRGAERAAALCAWRAARWTPLRYRRSELWEPGFVPGDTTADVVSSDDGDPEPFTLGRQVLKPAAAVAQGAILSVLYGSAGRTFGHRMGWGVVLCGVDRESRRAWAQAGEPGEVCALRGPDTTAGSREPVPTRGPGSVPGPRA